MWRVGADHTIRPGFVVPGRMASAGCGARGGDMGDNDFLVVDGITKAFNGFVANDGIGLRVQRGHVHALLGENGAGKSTLMKILYGVYRPDSGTIAIDSQPVRIDSPADARQAGIG